VTLLVLSVRGRRQHALDGTMEMDYLKAQQPLTSPTRLSLLTLFKSYPDDPESVCQSLLSRCLPLLTITTAQVLKSPTSGTAAALRSQKCDQAHIRSGSLVRTPFVGSCSDRYSMSFPCQSSEPTTFLVSRPSSGGRENFMSL
jgi:hypothetical protein